MKKSVSNQLREIESLLPEGDVKKKFWAPPEVKPPRRNPSVKNKSNRSDYMKNYTRKMI